ncbi:extracellular serine protease precursor [Neisseria meningitidis]|nr:extracellular serine protease precursor [Neisseria meningitidis]
MPPPPNLHTGDFTNPNDAYKNLINLKPAIEAGYTGRGVEVGIVDTGESVGSISFPELYGRKEHGYNENYKNYTAYMRKEAPEDGDGKDIEASFDDEAVIETEAKPTDIRHVKEIGHIDVVSHIIGGRSVDGRPAGGIAPDATLHIMNTHDGTKNEIMSAAIRNAWVKLGERGVRIVNNSFGTTSRAGTADHFQIANSEEQYRQALLAYSGGDKTDEGIRLMQQSDYGNLSYHIRNKNMLFIFSASNDAQAQPNTLTLLPFYEKDAQKGIITVAGVDRSGEKFNGSNHCGITAMWCLSAPYEASVRFTRTNPIQIAGTSFSAPIVTGTAALLLQKYPWMSNDNLRTTLLTTAQDIGAVGVDSKFGWGLLDTGKAMNGPASFPFGDFTADTKGTSDIAYSFRNDISGTGGLIKKGGSQLQLHGNNTYTGKTVIEGGSLVLYGNNKSDMHVETKGALIYNGAASGGSLNSDGIVYLADTDRSGANETVHIKGDLQLGGEGTLYTRLGKLLKVDGTAIIGGKLYMSARGKGAGYLNRTGQRVPFLSAAKIGRDYSFFTNIETDGGLLASLDSVEKTAGSEGDTLSYYVRRGNAARTASAAAHSAPAGLKHAVEQGGSNLENLMVELDASESSATPETVETAAADRTDMPGIRPYGATFRAAPAVQHANAADGVRIFNNLAATVYADSTAAHADMQGRRLKAVSDGLDHNATGLRVIAQTQQDGGTWEQGGVEGKMRGSTQTVGIAAKTGENTTAAATLGMGRSTWSENSANAKTDSISLFAGIRHDAGDIGYLKGLFSYGRYKNSISRSTGADEHAEGSVNGTLMQLGALGGVNVPFAATGDLTVEGGLRYDLLKQDAFAEKGSALGWSGNSLTEGTLVGLAGLKLSQPLSDKAVLFATAGVERDLNGRDYTVTGGFTGATAATGKTGARNMPHTRLVAGLGADVEFGNGWNGLARYSYAGSKQYGNHSGRVGVGYRF